MSGVPYSSNETDPDVGPRPATWYDGTPITANTTVWQQLVRHDRESITGRIGSQPANKSDTIWGILSADDGQGSAGKALIVDNTGAIANILGVGINTTIPTERLHIVDGNVLVTGGSINVGKNTDQTAHFGRGRISHFNITNSQTGATTSSVSFSHHDCALGTKIQKLDENSSAQESVQSVYKEWMQQVEIIARNYKIPMTTYTSNLLGFREAERLLYVGLV